MEYECLNDFDDASKPDKGKGDLIVDANDDYDIVEPGAAAMIESLRAYGYNLNTAISDLIDNSISAEADHIWIDMYWDGASSWVSIVDDGNGMDQETLVNAMRPGSQNPLDQRDEEDLGRFGLGLKTASFSQCRSSMLLKTPLPSQVPNALP